MVVEMEITVTYSSNSDITYRFMILSVTTQIVLCHLKSL